MKRRFPIILIFLFLIPGCREGDQFDPFDFQLEVEEVFLQGMAIGEVKVDETSGMVWVGQGEKGADSGDVYTIDPFTGEEVHFTAGDGLLGQAMIWSIEIDSQDGKWLGGWGKGLSVLDDGGTATMEDDRWWSLTSSDSCLASRWIRALYADNDGGLWITHTKDYGIDYLSEAAVSIADTSMNSPWGPCFHYDIENTGLKPFEKYLLVGLTGSADGSKWLAQNEMGIYHWDDVGTPFDSADDSWTVYDSGDIGGLELVEEIALDSQGRLWAACPGEGLIHGPDPWVTISWEDGLPDTENLVNDVTVDGYGRVWAFTSKGLAVLDQGGEVVRTMTLADDLPFDELLAGDVDAERGYAWIGGSEGLILVRIAGGG